MSAEDEGGTALVLVAGSESWTDVQLLGTVLMGVWHDALEVGYTGIRLLNGDADGADFQCQMWADANGIEHEEDPADWEGPCTEFCQPGHRKKWRGVSVCPAAGPLRNQRMVDRRPVLWVGFHRNNSRGTKDCMDRARKANIPILHVTTSGAPTQTRCTTL